jgi:hypothetical protein
MKTIKYISLFLALVVFHSCSHFDDLNTDPNRSSNMDPNLQITTIQMRQSEIFHEWFRYLTYPGGFMNQWTGNWTIVNYGGHAAKNAPYMEQMWISYYPYIIRDVVDVVQRTKDDPAYVNIHSVARILKVENFLKLTDTYGDIPYFNAGMGYYTGEFNAKYDAQEDIYNDFFKELSEASAALTADGGLITNDLYYNGDIEKWKRFAHSLHLRIAMRLVKVNPAKARDEAEKAIAAGVFTSNDDICYVKHENNPNSGEGGIGPGNGLATCLSFPDDPLQNPFRLATELIAAMEDSKDPRILYYGSCYHTDGNRTDITQQVKEALNAAATTTIRYQDMTVPAQMFTYDDWRPEISITVNSQPVTVEHSFQRLQPSKLITAYDAPFIHITYAEVEFLLAEAAQRGWNVPGSAQSHFEKGLEVAVRQWSLFGVTSFDEAKITEFISTNSLTGGNELLQINTQLWILHFLDPMETWANWRRTGLPDIPFYNRYPQENQSDGKTPRRLEYPSDEQLKNAANYRDALSRMGGKDDWTSRVWWDKE